ncbi:MAG TPA: hypothetical protein VII46_04640, partial [Acidimicrobiales bacterium]
LLPLLRAGGVRSVSANGVLGDPAGSSADEGARLVDLAVDELLGELAARRADGTRGPGRTDAPSGARS